MQNAFIAGHRRFRPSFDVHSIRQRSDETWSSKAAGIDPEKIAEQEKQALPKTDADTLGGSQSE